MSDSVNKQVPTIQLGTGDIAIMSASTREDRAENAIAFVKRNAEHPIAIDVECDVTDEEIENGKLVFLAFSNPKSIDAVLTMLQRLKETMTEETKLPHGPTISDYVAAAHANAVSKGWWDEDRSFGEIIALIHSEASEALEDLRNGHEPTEVWYEFKKPDDVYTLPYNLNGEGKPCGIPSELADIVIRVFDAAGRYGIDLEEAIAEKMAYNATRPQRHGGKVL
ncbi:hypothetical protein [Cohnella sp. GCM10012308]|uniref:hypothetical protein n=1 Tax=Cohnella sp. GCM10012308 TaxID=3317329 RepID=UPI0036140752